MRRPPVQRRCRQQNGGFWRDFRAISIPTVRSPTRITRSVGAPPAANRARSIRRFGFVTARANEQDRAGQLLDELLRLRPEQALMQLDAEEHERGIELRRGLIDPA